MFQAESGRGLTSSTLNANGWRSSSKSLPGQAGWSPIQRMFRLAPTEFIAGKMFSLLADSGRMSTEREDITTRTRHFRSRRIVSDANRQRASALKEDLLSNVI